MAEDGEDRELSPPLPERTDSAGEGPERQAIGSECRSPAGPVEGQDGGISEPGTEETLEPPSPESGTGNALEASPPTRTKHPLLAFMAMGPQSAFDEPPVPPSLLPTMSRRRRALIAAQCGVSALTASMNSSVIVPVVPEIGTEFGVSEIQTNLVLALSIVLFAVAPLVWAPWSDRAGRRMILLGSQMVALLGSVGCIFSPNYAAFLVSRLVEMAGSGACISIGAGVISDVFPREERGRALGTQNVLMLVGPLIAPVVAGVVAEHLGFRHVFSFISICNFLMVAVAFAFLPETLEKKRRAALGIPATAALRAEDVKAKPKDGLAPAATPDPAPAPAAAAQRAARFGALVAFRTPALLLAMIAPAVGYATYYALASSYSRDLQAVYGLSVSSAGYMSLPICAGMIIGSLVGGLLADRTVISLRRLRRAALCEDRLKSSWLGALLCPLGPLLYGWTIALLPWPVVIPAFLLLGFSNFLVQTVVTSYLVDCFPQRPAAIVSLLNAMRWLFGAAAPLIVVPGYSIGVGPFYTIISALNAACAAGMLLAAFLPWFAMDRLGKEPWASGSDAAGQRAAVERKDAIPWGRVLLGLRIPELERRESVVSVSAA
ncbi:major facilitator superfamily domain-containing protein [Hyaloraphidium curvatum]|nr:major facilitator superfamily domain-containing protein [Hyaloraphidium curvatum]